MMLYWSQPGGFSITSEDSLFFVPFSLQTESTAIALLLQPLGLDLSTCITHTAKVSCFGSAYLSFLRFIL